MAAHAQPDHTSNVMMANVKINHRKMQIFNKFPLFSNPRCDLYIMRTLDRINTKNERYKHSIKIIPPNTKEKKGKKPAVLYF